MTDNPTPHVKPFSAYLMASNSGRTHSELSDKLHELTEAVLRTGKPGTLVLTIKVDADNTENRRLSISEVIASKPPRPVAKKSIFWSDSDGNLVRNDPSQLQFGDLRDASPSPEEKQA